MYLDVMTTVNPASAAYTTMLSNMAAMQLTQATGAPVTVEEVTPITLENTNAIARLALKLACPKFDDLPATLFAPKNATSMVTVEISYSNTGGRHRCHRGGTCILTDKHPAGPECAKIKRGGLTGSQRAGKAATQRGANKSYAGAAGAAGPSSAGAGAATAKRPRGEPGNGKQPMVVDA
jgi:hypothetical protein